MLDTEIGTEKFAVQKLPIPAAPTVPAAPASDAPSALVTCANCGTPLAGPYCAQCGQHVADFHRSVWRFVADFFDNAICWDNKLFRTLGPLLKSPGLLTHEFMIGRRVRYVHPLRLFLFTSAVCLALLQYSHFKLYRVDAGKGNPGGKRGLHVNINRLGDRTPAPTAVPAETVAAEAPAPPAPSTANDLAARAKAGDEDEDAKPQDADAIRARVNAALSDAMHEKQTAKTKGIESGIEARIAEAGGSEKFSRALSEGIQQKLSWVALGLLPVFALGLRAVYWRKDSYYFAHLIFSLHYHTFLLLFWTGYTGLIVVVAWLPFSSLWSALARFALLWPPVYLYAALRRMYADGPKRTAVKVALLGSMHLLAILIGVAMVGALAFFSTGK